MEALEQLRRRLTGLGQLRGIVKTMKALSAANIRQYQRAAEAMGHYYGAVERGLQAVMKDIQPAPPPRWQRAEPPGLAAIVFGSDHGLCGRFNEELARYACERMDAAAAAKSGRRILAVGARAAASLEQQGQPVEEDFLVPGAASRIAATVQQILLKIDEWHGQADVHYVYLFYNRFLGGRTYRPTGVELMPMDLRRFQRLRETPWPSRTRPAFTMDTDTLLSRLIRQYLFSSVFRACAESQASEHASRLAAMQSAQRNLDEHLEELTMAFRRARQSAITAEMLEVVAGYEAAAGNSDRGDR